jgi:hypothetical protein
MAMSLEPTQVLQESAKIFKGRLSRCLVYDANVCSYRSTPDKPWELIPVSGEPFVRELRFTHRDRRIKMFCNSVYVEISIEGTFTNRPFSINAKQNVGRSSLYADTFSVSSKQYPVFTEDGKLSPEQESLLGRPEVISLVEQSNLQEGESLYFNRGEVGFYLKRPTTDQVSSVINCAIELAAAIEIAEEKLDLKLLPKQFHPVIQLIEKWALANDSDRDDLLASATETQLRQLVDEVNPYLQAIDSYLDSFRETALSEQAVALGTLAECALEAKQRLHPL